MLYNKFYRYDPWKCDIQMNCHMDTLKSEIIRPAFRLIFLEVRSPIL